MNKPNRQDLITAITAAIGTLETVYAGKAQESDLYEAALLALAVKAAKAAGGNVMLTDDGGTPASSLRFRTSPGNLWSGNFTYALVTFPAAPGKSVEIHLGAYVLANSKVAHECDIAIFDRDEAERSRQGAVHPRVRGLIAAIEAKHYTTSPRLGVGRGFLGLANELGSAKCHLTFPAKESSNIGALIAAKTCEAFGELIPGNPAAERLRARLEHMLRNWLLRG